MLHVVAYKYSCKYSSKYSCKNSCHYSFKYSSKNSSKYPCKYSCKYPVIVIIHFGFATVVTWHDVQTLTSGDTTLISGAEPVYILRRRLYAEKLSFEGKVEQRKAENSTN